MVSLSFNPQLGTAKSAPPEFLRLQRGSYWDSLSAVYLWADPEEFKVISKNLKINSKSARKQMRTSQNWDTVMSSLNNKN